MQDEGTPKYEVENGFWRGIPPVLSIWTRP